MRQILVRSGHLYLIYNDGAPTLKYAHFSLNRPLCNQHFIERVLGFAGGPVHANPLINLPSNAADSSVAPVFLLRGHDGPQITMSALQFSINETTADLELDLTPGADGVISGLVPVDPTGDLIEQVTGYSGHHVLHAVHRYSFADLEHEILGSIDFLQLQLLRWTRASQWSVHQLQFNVNHEPYDMAMDDHLGLVVLFHSAGGHNVAEVYSYR
jgi:hypothetical protein